MVGLMGRAESADRTTLEWHEAGLAATPFVMADDSGALVAHGVRRALPSTGRASLGEAAAALLADAADGEGVPLLVGALAFAGDRPAHLFQPRNFRRLAPGALARELANESSRRVSGVALRASTEPTREGYEKLVAAALARLAGGACHALRKVVLARTLEIHLAETVDLRALLTRLHADRSATTFCVPLAVERDGVPGALVGATPELLIDKRGAQVVSRPLAGSARRSSDPRADRVTAGALARSAKDKLEHALVVEHVADTLAPYCRELRVPTVPELTSTSTMWHLGTTVRGTLHDAGVGALQLAAELHPTPAVCGLPHDLALETIAELEPFERGYFAGAVGWCDARGDGRWLVAIRCAEIVGTTARLYAGAGIVAGSEPAAEAAETAAKFATMLRALGVEWREQ